MLKKQSCEISLSEPIDNDKDGNVLALMDVISCEDNMLESVDMSEKRKKLHALLSTVLDRREKEIIILRYGISGKGPQTQRKIAKQFGISRSYVSRIEKKALKKLEVKMQDSKLY